MIIIGNKIAVERKIMQLKMQTDYAIRILLYLSIVNRVVSTKELSKAMQIAETYCPKIIKQLKSADLIASEIGKDGGYRLAKKPSQINLFQIMTIMEDTINYNRCLEKDAYCSRDAVGDCVVHDIYETYQQMSEDYFKSFTLDKLVELST